MSNTNNVATATQAAPATTGKQDLSKFKVAAKADEKPAAKEPTKEPAKRPAIEERIKKFERLQNLLERRDTIKEALDNVSSFYISPAGTCNLKFQDSNGKGFGIAHPSVIGEMVHLAKVKLEKELQEIEDSFDFAL